MRVLFLTHRLPYAPNRGDRIRSYYILRTLRDHASVNLVSLVHDPQEAEKTALLDGLVETVDVAAVPFWRNRLSGAASLGTRKPLTHALLDSPAVVPALRRLVAEKRPDVVYAFCSGMARFALQPPLAGLPTVLDLVDVDSMKWTALAEVTRPPLGWIYRREGRYLAEFEAEAARSAFTTLVVNDREADALRRIVSGARIDVIPSGVEFDRFRPTSDPAATQDVVFCGVMDYPPNEQGAIWMAREVWPAVRRASPNARLRLVGSRPTRAVVALGSDPTIEVTGEVPDVRPYLWNAAVAAAPLHTARGLQNKVLEAVAAGLPVVVTAVVADGLPKTVLPACRTAESPQEFAAAIIDWLATPPAVRRALANGVDLTSLSWSSQLAPLVGILEMAARSASRQAPR